MIWTLARRPHEWGFLTRRGERYAVRVRGGLRVNDDHALRRAALGGPGIVRMPKLFVHDAGARGDLVQLWPDDTGPSVALAVVYPSRRELPAKVRVFVEFVAEIMAPTASPPPPVPRDQLGAPGRRPASINRRVNR